MNLCLCGNDLRALFLSQSSLKLEVPVYIVI